MAEAGPWEDFQQQDTSSGPWEDYAQPQAQPQPQPDEGGVTGWLQRAFSGARLATPDEYSKAIAPMPENVAIAAAQTIQGLPQMAESLPRYGYEGLKFAAGGPQERAQAVASAVSAAVPQGRQLASDLQSPINSPEFARGLIGAGQYALPGLEIMRELRGAPVESPPVQAPPAAADVVAPAARAIRTSPETGFQFYEDTGEPVVPEAQSATVTPSEQTGQVAASPEAATAGDISPERQQQAPETRTASMGQSAPDFAGAAERPDISTPTAPHHEALSGLYGDVIQRGEVRSPQQLAEQGRADVASGKIDPYAVASKVTTGKAILPEEFSALSAEHQNLIDQATQAERLGDPAYDELRQRSEDFAVNVLKPAATKGFAEFGRALQEANPPDMTTLTGLRQAAIDRMGAELDAATSKKIDNLHQGIQGKLADVDAAYAKQFAESDRLASRERSGVPTREQLNALFKDFTQKICDL